MEESSTEQHGCFVLRAGACAVPVYDSTRCTRRITNLKAWQVVSGTKIISDALQLEDGTGWVKVSQMVHLEVEYTGTRLYRTGDISLARRYHPDHDARNESADPVTGMVVSSCRVKGTNGTYFVRLDGNPSCWLPETLADGKPLLHLVEEASLPLGDSVLGLHPMAERCRGLTVWRVEDGPVAVYPSLTRTSESCGKLQPGTVFSSIVRSLEEGCERGWPRSVMIGLEDGSGWVCEQQEAGKGRLRPVPVDYVRTQYRVNNGTLGLALRSRPDHSVESRLDPLVVIKGTVWSYARVIGSTGDVYVRVEGKAGWLFETLDTRRTLLRPDDARSQSPVDPYASTWDLDAGWEEELQQPEEQLSLKAARKLARRLGWSEVAYNEASRVVSFGKGDVRVNVYYTTGTVGTCLDHPVQGKTQMFRREVTVGELEAILINPRVHLGKGYKRREHMPLSPPAATIGVVIPNMGGGAARLASGSGASAAVPSEEDALKAQISRLEQAASEALEEKNSLMWQLEALRALRTKEEARREAEAARQAQEEEEEAERRALARREEERKQKEAALEKAREIPKRFYYCLGGAIQAKFGDKLVSDEIQDLAITAHSYIILYTNGRSACAAVPKGLYKKLRGRQSWLPRPTHLALGPYETDYFCVVFADGSYSAVGPPGLYSALDVAVSEGGVLHVALGPDDTWLVLYKNGVQVWSEGIPKGLFNQLNSRNPRLPRPVFVNLGPDDEWFVAYADGAWRANSHGHCAHESINKAKRQGTVRRVWYGEEDTYVVALS